MFLSSKIWNSVNVKSVFIGTMIAIIVLSFVIGVGVGGGMRSGLGINTAASVGDQEISLQRLNEVVQQYNRQGSADETRKRANIENALDTLIKEKVLIEEATRMGWLANDLEVANWVRTLPVFKDKDTKRFSKEIYQRVIKNGRFSETELFENAKEAIIKEKLGALITLPVVIPNKLLVDLIDRDNVQFMLEYIELKPNPANLDAALKKAVTEYLGKEANIKTLQDEYERKKQDYQHKAQYKVNSILIAWKDAQRAQGEALKRSKEEAHNLIKSLHEKVLAGEKLSTLSKSNNDDSVAKSKAAELGWVDIDSIDKASWAVIETLSKENPHSEIVETDFGYRLLELSDARPESKLSFNEVKSEIAQKMLWQETEDKLKMAIEKEFVDLNVRIPNNPPD